MIRRGNKYHAQKTTIDGIVFDSAKEAARYLELRLQEKTGKIQRLHRQVAFPLIPKTADERKCDYRADFCYMRGGKKIIEDVKSPITRKKSDYIIKRKLVKAIYIDGIAKMQGWQVELWDDFIET